MYDKFLKIIEAFSEPCSQFFKHPNQNEYVKFFKIIKEFFSVTLKIFETFNFYSMKLTEQFINFQNKENQYIYAIQGYSFLLPYGSL